MTYFLKKTKHALNEKFQGKEISSRNSKINFNNIELVKFLTIKGVEGSKMSSGRGQWPAKVFNESYEEKSYF